MTTVLITLLTMTLLVGCSGSVTDPQVAGGPNGTGLSYNPEIVMYNFKGGEAYQAGSSYKINFKVIDGVMGVNENVIEYKRDSETKWTLIQDKVLSSSELLNQVNWNIPDDLIGSDFKIRITAYGKIPATKQIESLSSFSIDGTAPTLNANGFSNPALPAGNPFLFFKLVSVAGDQDDLSGVGSFCLSSSTTEIESEDRCWIKKSLSSSTLPVYAGMLAQSFTSYLHVRDRAGNKRVNTDTTAKDKVALTQTVVTIPSTSDAFYKASSSVDVTRQLGLTIQNTSTSYNYSGFTSNSTQSIDPGIIAYLPSGAVLIRDRIKGLRKVDLVQVCGSEPCSSIIVGIAASGVDGPIGGTAKMVEPLRMHWSDAGIVWLLDRKSTGSSELVIRKIDFNEAQPSLVTVIGGGSEEADTIASPRGLKINYSEGLVFYGAFQALPNGWFIFNSTNPEAAINSVASSRYKLRIFKSTETNQIQTLYLDTKKVFDIAQNAGKDMIPTSAPAITFDENYQDIKNIYVRACELTLPVATGQVCQNSRILGFDNTGAAQANLQLSSFVNDGNLILESPNSIDIYAKSGISSEFRKYNSTSDTWEILAGNGSWGGSYCANGVTNSACSLRLKDAIYDSTQKFIFIMDQSKIRIVSPDLNKVYSLIE